MVTPSGIVTDVSPLSENAQSPIFFTESGMTSDVKDVQPEKAPEPMEIKVDGSETSFNEVQPKNAPS